MILFIYFRIKPGVLLRGLISLFIGNNKALKNNSFLIFT